MDQQPSGGRRVAFFGGSFDPPHWGHLAVARAAQAALRLDTVLFAPVGAQPLKPLGSSASFEDRLELTRLAIAGDPAFEVSTADAPKPHGEPNYTLETLQALRAKLPPGSTLFCLMGADSFLGLGRWLRAVEIPFVAPLIVASRPGQQLDDLAAALPQGLTLEAAPGAGLADSGLELRPYLLRNREGETTPFFLMPGVNVEISASEIREQIAAARGSQLPCHPLLPGAVMEAIRERGLYR
jgi:nicotinate-nucleotide adenylyltransferase